MTIIDISKELFGTAVYPGDPVPGKQKVLSFEKEQPDVCQLTELKMGSHTGTHLDAPLHFVPNGRDVAQMDLQKCLGRCKVVVCAGVLTKEHVQDVLDAGIKKILIKGNVQIDSDMAEYLVKSKLECIGVEMGTVATGEHQINVHRILLGAEVVILENLDLQPAEEGEYFLCACPLKMEGLDGSPVRAVLIKENEL